MRTAFPALRMAAALAAVLTPAAFCVSVDDPPPAMIERSQPPFSASSSGGGSLTDSIDSSRHADEKAHRVTFSGKVAHGIVGDRVGGHDTRRAARTVTGKGSWIAYRLKVNPRETTTLEVEEIYGRDRDVRGYLVLVDEKKTYLRTWQGSGAGPVHYFVQIPPTGNEWITVKFVSQSDTPFSISRLWAFANFARYFDQNHLAVPYYLAPTVRLSFSDFAADKTRLNQIKASLGDHPHAEPAFTAFIPYAALGAREFEERIDYALRLAQETGMPVQLGFDTWWANTPGGSDGKGGFWSDVAYQQVVYNATTGKYQLSIPNQWSNTAWLTVNHPDLNAFKVRRMRESMGYLQRRYRDLLAQGKQKLILSINLDNEPVYWASGNAGLGSDLLLADFNPTAVEAARRDGVILNPTDGLSATERLWLFRNLLGYNEMIAAAAAQALERDAVIVTGSRVSLPDDLLADNIYTQAMVSDASIQYPMLSSAYPLWETAAPGSARVGGEWNADTIEEREAVLHQIALGRNAAVNAEAGNNAQNRQGVRPGYALAQRYYTLYNYPLDKMDIAASEVRDLAQPFPAYVYQPVLLETRFTGEDWKRQAADYGSMQTGQIGNTAAVAAFPASSDRPGYLTYKVQARQGGLDSGLFLELTGRAFVFGKKDASVYVRVLAGATGNAAQMREVKRYFDTGHFGRPDRIDLSTLARGKGVVYVRIEMNAPGIPPGVLSWCSVRDVRFTAGWPAALTENLEPQDESLATARRQNLVVSWRRDAELAMEALYRQSGKRPSPRLTLSQKAYAHGAYADAYRLACEGRSILLPAVYQVQESGWLKPYPVGIDTTEPVTCTLQAVGTDQIRLTLHARRAAAGVTIRLRNLPPKTAYKIDQRDGEWTIRAAGKEHRGIKRTTDGNGALEISATAVPYPSRSAPRVITGIFRSRAGSSPHSGFFILPDDGAGRLLIPTGARTVLRRGQPGEKPAVAPLEDFRHGDQIEARLDEFGTAVEVKAAYQVVEGIVRQFEPLTPYAMPFIVTAEGGRRSIIDLSALVHTRQAGDKPVKALPPGSIDIKPGDRVRFRRNPSLNRVFELWKTHEQPATNTTGD